MATGFNKLVKKNILLATFRETFSGFLDAKDLGVISAKIKTKIVIIPVAIPTPLSPNSFIAIEVANAEEPMFTTLFPTSIALNILLGFFTNLFIKLAPLTSSSTICLIRILLKDVKAVSEAENRADNPIKIINIINCIIVVESTSKHTPTFYFKCKYLYLI